MTRPINEHEMDARSARKLIRAHRGEIKIISPLPDDFAYIRVPKRAALDLVKWAENVNASVSVNPVGGDLIVVSCNFGYADELEADE